MQRPSGLRRLGAAVMAAMMLAGPSAAASDPRVTPDKQAYASMLKRFMGKGRGPQGGRGGWFVPYKANAERGKRRQLEALFRKFTNARMSPRTWNRVRKALARGHMKHPMSFAGVFVRILAQLNRVAQAAHRQPSPTPAKGTQ